MAMPGRSFATPDYRYGFNGQEKDDEVSGSGNTMTAAYWEYDTRLARRWNIDPKYKHYLSNYSVFGLNPILNVDPNGDDFYKNKITGKIEEHKSGWRNSLSESEKRNWNHIGIYKAKDWQGNPYYNDQSNFYTLARIAEFDNTIPGGGDPGNSGYRSETEIRVAKDIVIITAGVITIAASGGTASPLVASFMILSGTTATAGGSIKLLADGLGKNDISDKVPTGYLGATLGSIAEYTLEGKTKIYVKGALTITEGAITFTPYKLPESLLDATSKTATITSIVIDGDAQNAGDQISKDIIPAKK